MHHPGHSHEAHDYGLKDMFEKRNLPVKQPYTPPTYDAAILELLETLEDD